MIKINSFFKKVDILIYDDIYPHPISLFRLEELNNYLKFIKNSYIHIDGSSYIYLKSNLNQFKIDLENQFIKNPNLKNKVFFEKPILFKKPKLFYCIFLHNIVKNFAYLNKNKIPFIFELYPGGSLDIKDETTKQNLLSVATSELCKKILVTQKTTFNFLVNDLKINPDKLEYIFGCVIPDSWLNIDLAEKKSFGNNKELLEIAFCAAKYMENGEDKGFDQLLQIIKHFNKIQFVRKIIFHVIGGFNETDIVEKFSEIPNNIKFHGYLIDNELKKVFLNCDVLISPNKPFVLSKGAYDGFPTASATQAALCGCKIIVSDYLNENVHFNENEILIAHETREYIALIEDILKNPSKFLNPIDSVNIHRKTYSYENQMLPRIALLNKQ